MEIFIEKKGKFSIIMWIEGEMLETAKRGSGVLFHYIFNEESFFIASQVCPGFYRGKITLELDGINIYGTDTSKDNDIITKNFETSSTRDFYFDILKKLLAAFKVYTEKQNKDKENIINDSIFSVKIN